ncbi:hypothetical protein CVT24_002979 [Panaeolus cyanescens]|uniref:F-box domain-containing protein n=1 Tax=Panaeolus cyanescens TaxID=181874 RepID=A0A409VU45_9AGAR|nr:hypothetical protein CVT24_002979 [Panaeolus cyanescens]
MKFTDLPLDIHILIFTLLQPLDIIALGQTCSTIRELSHTRFVWTTLLQRCVARNGLGRHTFQVASRSTPTTTTSHDHAMVIDSAIMIMIKVTNRPNLNDTQSEGSTSRLRSKKRSHEEVSASKLETLQMSLCAPQRMMMKIAKGPPMDEACDVQHLCKLRPRDKWVVSVDVGGQRRRAIMGGGGGGEPSTSTVALEGQEPEPTEIRRVWLAPGGRHMLVHDGASLLLYDLHTVTTRPQAVQMPKLWGIASDVNRAKASGVPLASVSYPDVNNYKTHFLVCPPRDGREVRVMMARSVRGDGNVNVGGDDADGNGNGPNITIIRFIFNEEESEDSDHSSSSASSTTRTSASASRLNSVTLQMHQINLTARGGLKVTSGSFGTRPYTLVGDWVVLGGIARGKGEVLEVWDYVNDTFTSWVVDNNNNNDKYQKIIVDKPYIILSNPDKFTYFEVPPFQSREQYRLSAIRVLPPLYVVPLVWPSQSQYPAYAIEAAKCVRLDGWYDTHTSFNSSSAGTRDREVWYRVDIPADRGSGRAFVQTLVGFTVPRPSSTTISSMTTPLGGVLHQSITSYPQVDDDDTIAIAPFRLCNGRVVKTYTCARRVFVHANTTNDPEEEDQAIASDNLKRKPKDRIVELVLPGMLVKNQSLDDAGASDLDTRYFSFDPVSGRMAFVPMYGPKRVVVVDYLGYSSDNEGGTSGFGEAGRW